jgi:hypothetical protein
MAEAGNDCGDWSSMKGRKQKSAQHGGRKRKRWQEELVDDVGGREKERKGKKKEAPREKQSLDESGLVRAAVHLGLAVPLTGVVPGCITKKYLQACAKLR